MQCELLTLEDDPGRVAQRLRALVPAAESVAETVAEIIGGVRQGGDEALLEYTRRFDTRGEAVRPLKVDPEDLARAADQLEPELRGGLELAIANVDAVARGWEPYEEATVEFPGSHSVRLRRAPVARAAVYVPAGRAPYPSTVIMGVIAARAAGVEEVAVCAPPGHDGELDPLIMGACALTGASDVYRMGGAQAVAALAYGTDSVKAVEVIVGPGNLYVQEAKRQVFGQVGIDGFAGPSDLLLIADDDADPALAALDLLAQAEHGTGTLVIAVSTSRALLDAVAAQVREGADTGAVARMVQTPDFDNALALAEAFAPEHLELVGTGAEALAPAITRAGCLFVGASAATAFGDYIAGSNHVLPTGGAARFASGLSPRHFTRTFSEVRIDDPSVLARAAAPIASAEGFKVHARSMRARIRDNDRR